MAFTKKKLIDAAGGENRGGQSVMGPWLIGSKVYIAVGTSDTIDIYSVAVSDITGTWTLEDTWATAGTGDANHSCWFDGTNIHGVIVLDDSTDGRCYYNLYTVSSDSWGTEDLLLDASAWSPAVDRCTAAICVTNGATPWIAVAFTGPAQNVKGTEYVRLLVWGKTLSGGSWAQGAAMFGQTGIEGHFVDCLLSPGSDDWVHVSTIATLAAERQTQSWKPADDSISTAIVVSVAAGNTRASSAIAYDDGGTWVIRHAYNTDVSGTNSHLIYNFKEDGSEHAAVDTTATTTVSDGTNYASGNPMGQNALIYAPTAGKEYLLLSNAKDASSGMELYVRDSGAAPGSFSSDTNETSQAIEGVISGNVIARDSSNFVDVIVIEDADDWTYYEVQEDTSSTTDGVGSSSPSLTTAGVGISTFAGDGASTPSLTSSGDGISTAAVDGVSAPSLTTSGVGISTHKADGTSAPSLTTSGIGAQIFAGVGSSSPSLTVSGDTDSIFSGDGLSTPTLTTTGVGRSTHEAAGASAPSLTTSGAGAYLLSGVGASSPSLTVAGVGVGAQILSGAGTSSPSLTTVATGAPIFAGVGTSSPTLTTAGVGATSGLSAGVGTSSPSLTTSGVGRSTHEAVGASTPSLTTAGVGISTHEATGASTPTLTTSGAGAFLLSGVGVSTPALTTAGAGSSTAASVGTSAPSLTTSGAGAPRFAGVGTSTPSLTTTATGITFRDGVGTSTPSLTSSAVGNSVFVSAGTSAASLASTALGATVLAAVGLSNLVLTSIGVGQSAGATGEGVGSAAMTLTSTARGSIALLLIERVRFASVGSETIADADASVETNKRQIIRSASGLTGDRYER